MVASKQLSLAALVWLGLANQGLALDIDQATNGLTLVERSRSPVAMTIGLPSSHIIHNIKIPRGEDWQLESREPKGSYGGRRNGGPRGGPRHGTRDIEELDERDLEEFDLEARSPMMPHRMGGRRGGGRRPRDVKTRQSRGRGGFRAGGGHRHGRRDVEPLEERDVDVETRQFGGRGGRGGHRHGRRGLEEFDLEARSPMMPPRMGGRRGGGRRPRDIEARQSRGRGAFRAGSGHRSGRRAVEELAERDMQEFDLKTRSPISSSRRRPPKDTLKGP